MGDLKTANTSYPTTLDTYTLIANVTDEVVAAHINGGLSAIIALEAELGTAVKGTATDLKTRLSKNMHNDGGILRGTSFPVSPPNMPHLFWRTDLTKLYIYDTSLASYGELANSVSLSDYVSKTVATTITAQHTFNPSSTNPPFVLGANAIDQKVVGLNADKLDGYTTAEASTASTIAARNSSGNLTAKQLISDVANGTAPLVVTSTTEVANLKSATATTATNLSMNGEASATSATSPVTLDLGTVTAGDRIYISGAADITLPSGAATSYGKVSVSKSSGTATIVFKNGHGTISSLATSTSGVIQVQKISVGDILQVTGNGTLVMQSTVGKDASTTLTDIEIYAFFLKKA